MADRAAFLAATDSAPWALDAVSSSMRFTTKESTTTIDDRILALFPKSTWAENVLINRASEWRDSLYAARDSTRPGPKSDSVVARQRYLAAMEAFVDKPWTADPGTRDRAILSLFFEVREDSTYPAQKMTSSSTNSWIPNQEARRASATVKQPRLSNRKLELPYAERLARGRASNTRRDI